MDAIELKDQRTRAKAKLDLVKMMHRRRRATDEELQQAQAAYDSLKGATPVVHESTKKETQQKRREEYRPEVTELTPEAASLVETIQGELFEIDQDKRRLSNRLAAMPENRPCKELVDQILSMREAWSAKGDELRYAMQYGTRPETKTEQESQFQDNEFIESLPRDKVRLDQMIRNEKSNVSKYRKKFRESATDAKKSHYSIMIAKAETRINSMETYFNSLS